MTHLSVTLAVEPDGVRVTWTLSHRPFDAGDPLAHLPVSIAGAPTVELAEGAVVASDAAGPVHLTSGLHERGSDGPVRRWVTDRPTVGPVEMSYLAVAITAEPLPATPPLELRREGSGYSAALKCFLVLPPGPEDLTFDVTWRSPSSQGTTAGWTAVTSLGEGLGNDGITGTGLEQLGDVYMMCGDLEERHHRDGQVSTWWLTAPGFDVRRFSTRLAATYELMSQAFDAPAHPYRVFLRAHPHTGANASAHPASFVMSMNPAKPVGETKIYETLAHELVHEWLHLDGSDDDVTWFNEGAADYYSLVVPHREGLTDTDAFAHEINLQARKAYASPRRHLTLQEAQRLFFTDFLAHWLPYTRGMFYLADVDARLRRATSGEQSVDDVVRDAVRRRRDGERFGVEQWCSRVEEVLGGDEGSALDALVFTGSGRPGKGSFGPDLEMVEVEVPVLDVGFDPPTFMTGRVHGLVPGGAADRAGLRDGDHVELPSYPDALALDIDDVLTIRATRDGSSTDVLIPLADHTTVIPQWHRA